MPITLEYDHNLKILRVMVIGELLLHEIASAFDEITSSDRYPSNVDTLWDLQEADLSSTSAEFWKSLIEIRKNRYPDRKDFRLALVASTDLSFGMLRMHEILSETYLNRKLMVFRDLSEAEQWILQDRTA